MTAAEQKEYDRIEGEKRKRMKEKTDQFYKDRVALVEKEKNRLRLARPELVLRMLPGRLKERVIRAMASKNVQGRHEKEMDVMRLEKVAALDAYMQSVEKERSGEKELKLSEQFVAALRARGMQKERERGGRGERER